MANRMDPDQTAVLGPSCLLLSFILDFQVILGNYLQQATSAGDIFRMLFFLGALRVKFTSYG